MIPVIKSAGFAAAGAACARGFIGAKHGGGTRASPVVPVSLSRGSGVNDIESLPASAGREHRPGELRGTADGASREGANS